MPFYPEIAKASICCFVMLLGELVSHLRHAFLPDQVGPIVLASIKIISRKDISHFRIF